jgi:hypothetical protein
VVGRTGALYYLGELLPKRAFARERPLTIRVTFRGRCQETWCGRSRALPQLSLLLSAAELVAGARVTRCWGQLAPNAAVPSAGN